MNRRRLLQRILQGSLNVDFADMVSLLEGFGFMMDRVRGSHHIFKHSAIPELANLQEVGGKAKPYQIRQVLKLIEKYDLRLDDDELEDGE